MDHIKEIDEFYKSMEATEAVKKQELLGKIELTKQRVASKDKAIEELKYERALVFNNLLDVINTELRASSFNLFRGFSSDIFWKAWRWENYKDTVDEELESGEISEEEYAKHKTCLNVTRELVEDKFFGDLKGDVKFKGIIKFWDTGYDYEYFYKDQEITIFIPLFYANDKNWSEALGGYKVNYKASEYCYDWICGGLEYQEVAKELQKWMRDEGWKKGE